MIITRMMIKSVVESLELERMVPIGTMDRNEVNRPFLSEREKV